jgi:3-oxoacyl-[acyl-carrier-protein] synthase II
MQQQSRNEVVITGIGLVTPLGINTNHTWKSLCAGRSGITRHHDSKLQHYPYNAVGLVTHEQELLDIVFSKKNQSKTDRFVHLAMLAGHEAINDSGIIEHFLTDRTRFGVCVGVGMGGLNITSQAGVLFEKKGIRGISPFVIPRAIGNMAANWLSITHQLNGPSTVVTSACSSGADAVGCAFRTIRDGYADVMLAGGAESCVIPLAIAAFGNMRTLSSWKGDPTKASRPFEKDRTGFVIAEGAGIVLLERKDHACKRGANVYASVVGYGSTSDAHHITAMHPDGESGITAIKQALHDANIDKSSVGYINAHGTGTIMNDATETKILKKVFGNYLEPSKNNHIVVSSTKSMTGHMIGAAGGAEVAFSALALKNQIVPPTINLDTPDPVCDLDYVPHEARHISIDYALSNSFGFGGGNAVIVLKYT